MQQRSGEAVELAPLGAGDDPLGGAVEQVFDRAQRQQRVLLERARGLRGAPRGIVRCVAVVVPDEQGDAGEQDRHHDGDAGGERARRTHPSGQLVYRGCH